LRTGCFGPKRDEAIGDSRKLHNEDLHDVYSSPSIITMSKSERMIWAGHVARMGRKAIHIEYWWGSQKDRDHWEDQDVGGWTVSGWILER
jgi:hypothetical protein